MNLIPLNPNVDKLGTATDPYAEVNANSLKKGGTEVATEDRKLDDFAEPDDNTDLDATTSAHGLMSKADKIKLDAIEAGATADQSNSEIEAAYNAQVPRISSEEITALNGTSVRRFAPEDIAAIITAHAPTGLTEEQVQDIVGALIAGSDTITVNYDDGANTLTVSTKIKSSGHTAGQGEISKDSNGLFFLIGTAANTAAAGNDARFPTSDQKAGFDAASDPITAGNPVIVESDARLTDNRDPNSHASNHAAAGSDPIKLDDFAEPDDNTDLDATTSKHGLMSKADKTKLDAIETSATADQTDEEIEAAYNNQVPQISAGEITAGTETDPRRMSPADVVSIIDVHAPTAVTPESGETRTYLQYREKQNTGVNGGGFTSGAWQKRVLNEEVSDSGDLGVLASGVITLQPGTYEFQAWAVGAEVGNHQARLRNTAAGTTLGYGSNEATRDTVTTTDYATIVIDLTDSSSLVSGGAWVDSYTFHLAEVASAPAPAGSSGSAFEFFASVSSDPVDTTVADDMLANLRTKFPEAIVNYASAVITIKLPTHRVTSDGWRVAEVTAEDGGSTKVATYSVGTEQSSVSGTSSKSIASGKFTIASASTIELQHRCQTTEGTYGLGKANAFGGDEVYAFLELWKITAAE